MSKRGNIFVKRRLTPGQLRAVASLRLDDARLLLNSGQNARMNGAMYMGGFVIECLLKALLLDRHPNLHGAVDRTKLSEPDREVHALLYSHDLDKMLGFLPEVRTKLESITDASGRSQWPSFNDVCEEWTVYARYSTAQAPPAEARRFLDTVEEVKEWLRQL
ncbi:MAG TPA: hypothetical protein VIL86_04185 [Tepidisphaeraceae bacterium]|jgi:hypothetical protein